MTATRTPLPVIAGIDGSSTSLAAALWAVDEAISRDAPLRLVYVTASSHMSAEDYAADVRDGHDHLRQARNAIQATGKTLTIDTEIVDGPPSAALIALSAEAQMICVGSVGIDRYARSILGSTAAELAEKAQCPVAVIRPDSATDPTDLNWIVVAITDQPDNETVVDQAMQEATLRHAPVLALGAGDSPDSADTLERQTRAWGERYPGVHIYPIASRADVVHFLNKHDEHVLLVVIGDNQAQEVAQIVGRGHGIFGHGISHHSAASALVVRS